MPAPSTSSLPQSGSIVSRWKLDEASGNAVDSVGSNTLTDTNTVGTSADVPVQGFAASRDFEDASSEYFTINDNASLSITGTLTMSFWFKLESDTDAGLVTKYNETANQVAYWAQFVASTDKITFGTSNGTSDLVVSSATFSTGVWYHITCVYEPSTRMEIYVNGVSDNTNTTTINSAIQDTTAKFQIGNFDSPADSYDGLMQDVILWGAALTDAEVLSLYNRYYAPEVFGSPIFFI